MASQWTPAYVLHQRPFRDQSVVLELLTQDGDDSALSTVEVGVGRRCP